MPQAQGVAPGAQLCDAPNYSLTKLVQLGHTPRVFDRRNLSFGFDFDIAFERFHTLQTLQIVLQKRCTLHILLKNLENWGYDPKILESPET